MRREHWYVTAGIDPGAVRAQANEVRRGGRHEPRPSTIHFHSTKVNCPGHMHEEYEILVNA